MNRKDWQQHLQTILNKIDIKNPKRLSLYQEAFTHKSYANEHKLKYNQQRLEFLGDSAISWIISNYLYSFQHPILSEGDMTIIKSRLVSTDTLAKAACEIGLEKLLFLSKGAASSKISNKILEDTFEAFVGAIAQDQGIKKARKLIDLTLVKYHQENLIQFNKDYKTQFQEFIQSSCDTNLHKIEYLKETDENDDKKKIVKLYFMGNLYGTGEATSFKKAEQLAAKEALSKCQTKKRG